MNGKLAVLWQSVNKRVLLMAVLLVVVWIVFHFLSGGYVLHPENMANLFRQVTVVAVLSIPMTLVIVSGNIDLSVGSALGMFGALSAALVTQVGLTPWIALVVVLLLGTLVGSLHGALIHYLRIPAFVVTLGGLIAYRGVTQYVARQSIPIRVEWIKGIAQGTVPTWLSALIALACVAGLAGAMVNRRRTQALAQSDAQPLWTDIFKLAVESAVVVGFVVVLISGEGLPTQVLVLLVLGVALSFVAQNTPFGHYVYAIGGNRQAAHYSGISIAKNTITVFALMGMFSAVAGVISVAELSAAAPDIGELKELEAIAACVIGGTSLMGGSGVVGMSILGALIMASIKNGMSMVGIVAQMQKVILGSVLVVAVALDQWSRRRSGGR